MPSKAQITGSLGEDAAVIYLKNKQFIILDRNYRIRNAEIDIIAKDKDTIAFIEVKTRKSLMRGLPAEAVNYTKQKKIIFAALYYIRENNLDNMRLRFDVVEVYEKDTAYKFNLIRNAFQVS